MLKKLSSKDCALTLVAWKDLLNPLIGPHGMAVTFGERECRTKTVIRVLESWGQRASRRAAAEFDPMTP
jgi:glycerate kinase